MEVLEKPNTIYALSYSYGKDSGACIHVIKDILKWPLDVIITADVWATDTIPAELPPMVNWKAKADKIILDRYGIPVTHVCAMASKRELPPDDSDCHTKSSPTTQCSIQKSKQGNLQIQSTDSPWSEVAGATDLNTKRLTYEGIFYRPLKRERERGLRSIYGFPIVKGNWCNSYLKRDALQKYWLGKQMVSVLHRGTQTSTAAEGFSASPKPQGADKYTVVQYLGIAADEPLRIAKHKDKPNMLMPLVEAGWTEQMCRDWCEENDLLSPTYGSSARGGCWFCHNQSVEQLRQLRHNYPEYWQLMLKWDNDSPVTFKPDGHTVHDFDKRFQLEDEGFISPNDRIFRWAMLNDELNYRWF